MPDYSQCVPLKHADPITPIQVPISEPLTKRATPPFDPIVGADSCTNCWPRRKIQTLQSSYPAVFNMLLLAMEALQNVPESQDISWYQIAGMFTVNSGRNQMLQVWPLDLVLMAVSQVSMVHLGLHIRWTRS